MLFYGSNRTDLEEAREVFFVDHLAPYLKLQLLVYEARALLKLQLLVYEASSTSSLAVASPAMPLGIAVASPTACLEAMPLGIAVASPFSAD
jgi:hypothetical protein